jgi:hypothetical protein
MTSTPRVARLYVEFDPWIPDQFKEYAYDEIMDLLQLNEVEFHARDLSYLAGQPDVEFFVRESSPSTSRQIVGFINEHILKGKGRCIAV